MLVVGPGCSWEVSLEEHGIQSDAPQGTSGQLNAQDRNLAFYYTPHSEPSQGPRSLTVGDEELLPRKLSAIEVSLSIIY